MPNALFEVPKPHNEPIYSYAPGSPERELLFRELDRQTQTRVEIPLIIGGRAITTDRTARLVMPHDHTQLLGTYHQAGADEIRQAIAAAMNAKAQWEATPWIHRVSIALKAAELISTKYRYILNAATMLNQSKNVYQAEIDATCEFADFLRFNALFMQQIYSRQPISSPGVLNRCEYRPLEGFVFAATPFNFTSIAGNLASAPAFLGNTVIWKPASTAVLAAYHTMRLFEEAGMPAGVINFVPGSGAVVGAEVLTDPDLAGIHFTGSTPVFQHMWQTVGNNIRNYRTYPRLVGETGGKDFVFAHASADIEALCTGLVRGAFEYQGQKCSAASRAYIPNSLWPSVRETLQTMLGAIKVGDPRDLGNFVNAMIDEKAFDKAAGYIARARAADTASVIFGGQADKSRGYFIQPTVIETRDPHFETMIEEIFAPVLTIYVYQDADYVETLELCDRTSPYALTGAIFGTHRQAIVEAERVLCRAAGNFYINDKPTGAVVGQQPFGGSRASGTNDKAGSDMNLLRWISTRAVKETLYPPGSYEYPHMQPSD